MTTGSRARRWALPLALGLALALLAAAWVGWQSRPVAADAVEVRAQALQRTLLLTARVHAPQRVEVGSTLTARVVAVAVDEGDAVAAGSLLLSLDDTEPRAALAQAQAARVQAQARLAAQRQVAAPAAAAALAQAEASHAAAARELARSRELLAQGFISAARLDEAQRQADIAAAQREAARVQAAAQREDGADALAARAQLDAAQAALQAAQARLAQTVLHAPVAARVVRRHVEPGLVAQPGRALLVLAPAGPTELLAAVDERFYAQLQPGQRAQALADAHPLQPFAARVARIAPAVDAQRGAVEVRLVPEGEAPAFLREDMTLSVEVVTAERAAARVLPLAALRAAPAGARAQVLVVHEGRAAVREVGLGLRTLDRVEVTDGLADGELVLLAPAVQPGQRVRARVLDAAQAAAAAGPRTGGGDGIGAAMGAAGAR
jgi:HlyD family secretion protein